VKSLAGVGYPLEDVSRQVSILFPKGREKEKARQKVLSGSFYCLGINQNSRGDQAMRLTKDKKSKVIAFREETDNTSLRADDR
jgi:hypothetical protein